jgi:thiosulfate/3-mercaptopyruvate sulfurtransferase
MVTISDSRLLSPEEVHRLQSAGDALVVDVRDADDYAISHVAGAVNIPQIFYHLSTTTAEELETSRALFEDLFASAGVTSDTLVVLYEDGLASRFGGSFRGWWWLGFFGHENAAVLDGGFKAWEEAGLPVDDVPVERPRSDFKASLNRHMLALKEDVVAALEDENVKLLDNRDAVEWFCESSSPYDTPEEDFSPRRGRIPGATWVEWTKLMTDSESPTFRSPEEIREIMGSAGLTPDDDIIIYCFKGSRASNTFAALRSAGFGRLRNYLGSWYEWSAIESLPIEQGARPT